MVPSDAGDEVREPPGTGVAPGTAEPPVSDPAADDRYVDWLPSPRASVRLFAAARSAPAARRLADLVEVIGTLAGLLLVAAWSIPTRPFDAALAAFLASAPSWMASLWSAISTLAMLPPLVVAIAAVVRRRWRVALLMLTAAVAAVVADGGADAALRHARRDLPLRRGVERHHLATGDAGRRRGGQRRRLAGARRARSPPRDLGADDRGGRGDARRERHVDGGDRRPDDGARGRRRRAARARHLGRAPRDRRGRAARLRDRRAARHDRRVGAAPRRRARDPGDHRRRDARHRQGARPRRRREPVREPPLARPLVPRRRGDADGAAAAGPRRPRRWRPCSRRVTGRGCGRSRRRAVRTAAPT